MSTVGKLDNRTQRKTGKKSLKVRSLQLARKKYQEELQKEKKLARDVAGLLSDIVNNIAIQQTPSTAHPHTEQNYTLHSIGSPSDCSTYRSVATQTYFEEIFELPKLRPREAKINGRRVIDFQYFFNELKDVSNHGKSLCNLNNMVITKEEKRGICTSYNLKCLVCNFEKNISSESPYRDTNINADFVSGILSIICDFMDAYILLAQIHLPLLNNDEFIQESKNVCLTMDKITQRLHQDASKSLKKQLQKESLVRKLVAMKRRICPRENIQREHQLTITTQQCSSVSDNSNIQRESQLTTMKQSSSAHENIQKKFQLTTLKQNSSAHKNIQREPRLATMKQSSSEQKESLVRKLVAMKRRICPRENIQREHQLTITTQQCSSVSDNSNIQRESQLTTLKQNSSAHENMQREHQLTTTTQQSSSVSDNSNIQRESQLTAIKQSSSTHENTQRKLHLITLKQDFSAHKHIQRKPQLTTMKQSSSAHENVQREHKLITTQQCSSTSDNSNLFEQVHSGGLSVEDEFEIKEENVAEEENEFETMMPDQTTKTSNSKLFAGREQVILNTMTVKQEIDSDDENSNKSITKERTNKKSVMVFVNAEQIGAMLTQANEGRVCENTMVVNEEIIHSQKNASNSKLIAGREQVILNTITVTKQEIDSDDENFDKPITKETTKEKSVFVFVNAEQIGAMLTQANEGRACENENTMVVNEEKIHLQKNAMVDNNMLVKPEFHDVEMTNKERVTDFDNKPDSESPFKKARTVTYKESNNSDTQGTPTIAPNKEITVFQNRFESNRLATSATNNLINGTATSSVTNVRTVTISVTKAGGEKITFSIPVKFNENGAPIIPQNIRDKASGTYQVQIGGYHHRQKELESNFSLFNVSKVVEEESHIKQNLSSASAQEISSVQTYSGHRRVRAPRTPENTTITDLISSVPKGCTYSPQIPVSSVAVESSSTVQKTSSKHPNYPVLGIPEDTDTIEIVSVASQYTNSSQLPTSSVAVKDKYVLPFAKGSVESSNKTQAVSSNDSLPSVSSTGTATLSVISNSVPDSLSKISPDDCASSLVVSTSDDCSFSSEVSTSDENTSEVLCTHRSIATQTNFRQRKRVPHRSVGTQMNFHALKTPKKIFKYRRRFAKTLERLPKAVRVKGRRIIDFQYFFKAIIDVNNHSKDKKNHSEAGCNLNNIFIKREKKQGIRSSFFLKCAVCNFKKRVWSENPKSIKKNLNTDFLSGMLSIECGFEEANILLSKMRLPLLKPNDFVKEYEKACKSSNVSNNKTNHNNSENLGENLQTELQLPDMLQCSSASDDSNFLEHVDLSGLLVEDQLEIKKENIIENKNEPETIILDQKVMTSDDKLISGQEHLLKNSNKRSQISTTNHNISENLGENLQTEPHLSVMLHCSSASDDSNFLEHVDLSGLLVEDHLEIKKENIIENKNEPETIILDQKMTTSDDKLISGQEHLIKNSNKRSQNISTTNHNISENLGENLQTEPHLPAMLHCSSASDDSNFLEHIDLTGLLVEDQKEIKKENIIEKNEPETIILDQKVTTSDDKLISGQEHLIKNSNKRSQNISKNSRENVQRKPRLTAVKQCSFASGNSSLFEQVDLGDLIVDQFEIKEENIENKNEPETIIPDQRVRTSDDKLIVDQEQVITHSNKTCQNISKNLVENGQNIIENKNEPGNVILGQRVRTSDNKLITDQEQLILNMTTVKLEINSDDEDLTSSVINETESKESRIDNYEQSVFRAVPVSSQQNEERTCEKRMIVNQEQINLHKNVVIINNQVNNVLVKPDVNTMEIIDIDSMTNFDYNSESELPRKKARTEIYKDSNNPACVQRIPRKTSIKEINNFQSTFESNGFATSTTIGGRSVTSTSSITSGKNLTATSSITNGEILTEVSSIANRENLTATSSITSEETLTAISSITSGENLTPTSSITTEGGDITFLIPVQHLPKSNENDALSVPQMPHYTASETCRGLSGTACISGIPSTIQQPANASAATYTLLAPTVVEQPANSSNDMPGVIPDAIWRRASSSDVLNANGVTYVPLEPTVFQQLVNSPNSTPGVIPAAIWQPTCLSDAVPKTIESNMCVQQPVKSSRSIPGEIPAAIRKCKI